MVGQRGIKTGSNGPPVRYEAIATCLEKVGEHALEVSASVHMPRIGCGLAGGRRPKIEPLLTQALVRRGIDVYVYDFD